MGSARLEIMDERDEDKEGETSPQKTAAPQPKVWVTVYAFQQRHVYVTISVITQGAWNASHLSRDS